MCSGSVCPARFSRDALGFSVGCAIDALGVSLGRSGSVRGGVARLMRMIVVVDIHYYNKGR